MTLARCRGCGATIVFLPTRKGKRMPVDVASVAEGDTEFDYSRHSSHFSSCPKMRKPYATQRCKRCGLVLSESAARLLRAARRLDRSATATCERCTGAEPTIHRQALAEQARLGL